MYMFGSFLLHIFKLFQCIKIPLQTIKEYTLKCIDYEVLEAVPELRENPSVIG